MVIDEALIQHVVRTIVAQFHPRRIILFGSHARGDATPDSDIDLFIEMNTPLDYWERARAVLQLFHGRRWAMDVIVYTPEEVARFSGRVGSIFYVIEREGKVLYEQPEPAVVAS